MSDMAPTTDETDIGDLMTAAAMDDLEVEIFEADDSDAPDQLPVSVLSQTTSVQLYDESCAAGITTKFLIPVMAWG